MLWDMLTARGNTGIGEQCAVLSDLAGRREGEDCYIRLVEG